MKVGTKPHPQILILGFQDAVAQKIISAVPTARVIQSLTEVEQIEFDAILVKGNLPEVEPHLYALVFADDPSGAGFGEILTTGGRALVKYGDTTRATEFEVSEELPGPLLRVVTEKLMPLVRQHTTHGVLGTHFMGGRAGYTISQVVPWVSDTRGRVIAGHFPRATEEEECWCIPPDVVDPIPWLTAALEVWNDRDSSRFPLVGDWRDRPVWRTHEETKLTAELDELLAERTRFEETTAVREQRLRQNLASARDIADKSERLLLTAKGAVLVGTVAATLEILGFRVEDMDAVLPEGQEREDLRVSQPGDPEWVCLVEVRGLAGGGAASDLSRLERFRLLFFQETQSTPSGCWYVVNQFVDLDPDRRAPLMGSSPSDVEVFAQVGGLVVDTRTLFRMRTDVIGGTLQQDQAINILQTQTGVLTYPAAAGTSEKRPRGRSSATRSGP